MENPFARTELLLGSEAMARLSKCRVAVFGIGGVGSYAAEALVRSGIGAIDLIDADTVSVSNINRQLFATFETVGKPKTEAARERLQTLSPDCRIICHQLFYLPDTADSLDLSAYDYIVDAVDTVTAKLTLATKAQAASVPLISVMGAGNKLDATAFEVADIYETSVCPLARIMRQECRKRGIEKLKCVYSKEEAIKPLEAEEELPQGRRALPGSIAFVPSVAGLIAAGEVIKDLCHG